MGKKTGEWRKFDKDGNQVITITYKNGKEIKYDGIKVN
jgi:antitoxin component YwqK of YwqJK toxin-antitoxin module